MRHEEMDSTYIQQPGHLSTTITLLAVSYAHSPHITIVSETERTVQERKTKETTTSQKRKSPKSIPTMQLPPTPAPRFLLFTSLPSPSCINVRHCVKERSVGELSQRTKKQRQGKSNTGQRIPNTTKHRNKKYNGDMSNPHACPTGRSSLLPCHAFCALEPKNIYEVLNCRRKH